MPKGRRVKTADRKSWGSEMRRSKRLNVRILTAALAMSASDVALVHAQDSAPTADPPKAAVERVTVTARKKSEEIQKVPVAVTVMTGDQLERQGADQVRDIQAFTPGLSLRSHPANGSALTLQLRGQYQNDILATLEPSVGVYVDDLYWARSYGLNSNLLDVDNVQILRGPQGTLFGRNTTGGAILIASKMPELDEFMGSVQATYGNYNNLLTTGVANVPIGGMFAVRGAIQFEERDGYIDGTVGPSTTPARSTEFNDRSLVQGRGSLLFQPADGVRLVLTGEWHDSDFEGPGWHTTYAINGAGQNGLRTTAAGLGFNIDAYVAATNADPYDGVGQNSFGTTQPFTAVQTETYTGRLSIDTGLGEFKIIAGTRNTATQNGRDLDGSPVPRHFTALDQDLDQSSIEAQLVGTTAEDRLDYAIGVTYLEESGFDKSVTSGAAFFDSLIDNQSVGIYGQFNYALTPTIHATAGLRYSEDEKGIVINNRINLGAGLVCWGNFNASPFRIDAAPLTSPNCRVGRTDTFDNTSYTLGLDWQADENTLLYAKFSTGYRAGGQNLRSTTPGAFIPFSPELIEEFEAGMKADLADGRVRMNVAVFYSTIEDAQRSSVIPDPNSPAFNATVVLNAAEVTDVGLEAELRLRVTEELTLSATGMIQDPQYQKFLDPQTGADRSLERFVGVANEQFSVAADYARPMSGGILIARIDYAWLGEFAGNEFFDPANVDFANIVRATTVPSAGELGARIGFAFDNNLDVQLWGRNILDNDSPEMTFMVRSPHGYVTANRREPATYGITASYKFGGS